MFLGNATERLIESSAVCQPGLELKVRVRTANQAENGEMLMGPWSVEGEYQCKPEGISDVRVHITVELVHVHRFEMAPSSYSFPPQVAWPSKTPGQPPTFQQYNQILFWYPYLPWYPPPPPHSAVTDMAPSQIPTSHRSSTSVLASFDRKKISRINHPWWWLELSLLVYLKYLEISTNFLLNHLEMISIA